MQCQCNSNSESQDDCDASLLWVYVHMELWQQQLMLKYGNIVSLMDATYKTTPYNLPLFCISIRTNIGYCAVEEFIVGSESSEYINTVKMGSSI